jgi:two-component system NtrC family sensor kinase
MQSKNWLPKVRPRSLSLRTTIVLGIVLGIIFPTAIIGPFLARQSFQRDFDKLSGSLHQYASMLEQTMSTPLWHVDIAAAQIFVDSVMLNPQVVSILVEDSSLGRFAQIDRPERRGGKTIREVRAIKWDGQTIGRVTIEMSSSLVEKEFSQTILWVVAALLFQLLVCFILLLTLFQRRMMRPLEQLQRDVDRMSEGKLETAVQVMRHDELGNLAQGVDYMREKLRELMALHASHNVTLEQRVTDRTIALHTSNQELRETLATLKNAQMEIQRSDRLAALGSLVAGVAHELNTPIGNCVTVASTLYDLSTQFRASMEDGLTRSRLIGFVDSNVQAGDILLRNLQNAAELIGSFKQVAVDRTSAQRRKFNLEEVIRETVLTMGARIKRSTHEIRIEVPDDITMDSYPGSLGQIVSNLINNAMLHGFDGRSKGLVLIQARMLYMNTPAAVELIVGDNGVGISEANLGRIFDPFFTTKLGQGGSGLGLNIVYNLISDVLGGSIQVKSVPGEGTQFILILPLAAPGKQERLPTP